MSTASDNVAQIEPSLAQVTARIRHDQKRRLEVECRARGVPVADVLRDNLDLAFAMKEEMATIVEGQYDGNDSKNAPRLIHSLLYRVEERLLGALDEISRQLSSRSLVNCPMHGERTNIPARNAEPSGQESGDVKLADAIDEFVPCVAVDTEQPLEVWIGAFSEIGPRLKLISADQIRELKYKGGLWLEEHGYYVVADARAETTEGGGTAAIRA